MNRKIAILGLGSRGQDWAAAFRDAGWQVSGFDPAPSVPGLAEGSRVLRRRQTISETVSQAEWVLVCVPERLELVQMVIQRAQAEAPDGAVIAVVSEAFAVDAVQGCAIRPGRIVMIAGKPAGRAELRVSHRNQPGLKVDALATLSQVCPGTDLSDTDAGAADGTTAQETDARSA